MGVAKECNSAMNGDRENSLRLSIQNALGSSFVLSKASRKLLEYVERENGRFDLDALRVDAEDQRRSDRVSVQRSADPHQPLR